MVIPREIRESLGLEPGQKVQAIEYEGRVEFVPVRKAKSLRVNVADARDAGRRLREAAERAVPSC